MIYVEDDEVIENDVKWVQESSGDIVGYMKETAETMNNLINSWIKDLRYGVMSLRNIEVACQGGNLNIKQREIIKEEILTLQSKIKEVIVKLLD